MTPPAAATRTTTSGGCSWPACGCRCRGRSSPVYGGGYEAHEGGNPRMKHDRRSILSAGVLLSVAGACSRAAAQTPPPATGGPVPPGLPQPAETIDLWPQGAPGMPAAPPVETVTERSTDPLVTDRAVLARTRPRLAAFRPDRPNGAALLLTPGGGYRHVVVDKEGYEMARWAAARGFTCFVLFYRLPGEGWTNRSDVALADAQRAM